MFLIEDEFKAIASLLVGSFYVSSTSQSFDKLKLIDDYNNDILNRLGELSQTQCCILVLPEILQLDNLGQILVQHHLINF